MSIRVLDLDLERTLASDAGRADPRPGLAEFLPSNVRLEAENCV